MSKSKKKSKRVSPCVERRSFFVNLWIITICAFALRLVVSWELGAINNGFNSVFLPSKLTDLATYLDLSQKIVEGRYEGVFYYQPYYYAVFLPLIRIFFGGSIWAIIIFQSIAGALSVFLVGLTGKILWTRKCGYWAAIFTTISTPLLLYTPYAQNETLQSFHLILLAYLGVKMLKNNHLGWVCSCGVVLGVATLTRGNAMLFIPGIILLLGYKEFKNRVAWSKIVLKISLLIFCFLAPQLPFIIHNSRIEGKFTGPSTAANAVLALGNTPEAPAGGRNPELPAGPMEYPESYSDFMARASERSVALQMWDYFQRAPLEFLELQWRKVILFWDYREIPNNVSLYGEGKSSKVLSNGIIGRSAVILTLAVAGMLFFGYSAIRRKKLPQLLIYFMIITYALATALFYILSRFRAPIIPLLTLFAGAFVVYGWRTFAQKTLRYRTIGVLVIGLFVVVSLNDLYRDNLEAAIMRIVRPNGTIYTLKSGQSVHLDHGPFTGGMWLSEQLLFNTILEKQFKMLPSQVNAIIEWKVLKLTPDAKLRGTINGVAFELPQSEVGIVPIKLSIPIKNGKIIIKVESVSGNIEYLYDQQRNYYLSNIDGELILRLTIPEK